MQAGAIAGPLVGGALIPVLGYSTLYLVDTVSLFTTLWAVVRLPMLRPELAPGQQRPAAGLRSVLDGFRYLRDHRVLLASFLVDLIAMIFGMPRALFPQMAHESFGGPEGGGIAFALLFAAIPLGAVIGGVFSGWVVRVRRQGLAVIVCILIWGAAIVVAGGALFFAHGTALPVLPVVVTALMIGGAADMASAAFRQTMLQAAATDDVRGRLQGVFIVVVAGGGTPGRVLGRHRCRCRHSGGHRRGWHRRDRADGCCRPAHSGVHPLPGRSTHLIVGVHGRDSGDVPDQRSRGFGANMVP